MLILPKRAKHVAKKLAQRVRLRYLAHADVRRFERHASLSVFDRDAARLDARIMYNVHALEKGLARNQDDRPGFGRTALANLNETMNLYRERGFDVTAFAYCEGLGILQRYVQHHADLDHDIQYLHNIVAPGLIVAGEAVGVAGTKSVRRDEKLNNASRNFRELALNRSSVREFSGERIDTGKVRSAIEIAAKSPSVCNRQGWRVYWIENKETSQKVLQHQRGFGYRTMPEVLLCVTVSNSAFVSPVERNQGYVDGGLFAMSIMYGLEYEGLAAVPLNACLYSRAQKEIRKITSIPEGDVIAMFIAVGDFIETSKVPMSGRRPVDQIVIER